MFAAAVTCAVLVVALAAGGLFRAEGAAASQVAQQTATPPGDASRGKALFESSGCFDCHRIGDRGSRLGPDLSDIGYRRTAESLYKALVAPDEEVVPENRYARVVTKDGTIITGKLLNQDSTSVQLMTPKEELKTYLRANLREYSIVDKGLMPSVQDKLTAQQVADIVAYLSSLLGS
jgi:putative heme-binding domain-containing protein